ncbi:MAG: hypothetical protein HS117_02390 [Verrucomicrobiaceae bacterium]|jgi:hypothetical protein|nr:hypothetical protein [Verrucomicrobiaceae bacterium]
MSAKSFPSESQSEIIAKLRNEMLMFQKEQALQAAKWKAALHELTSVSRLDQEAVQKRTDECINILIQRGWFISGWHTALVDVVDKALWLEQDQGNKCDAWFTEHFSKLAPTISAQIKSKFPDRSPVINDALEAHEQGKYNLSVPTLLAQADGLGHDIFGVSPYSRKPANTLLLEQWLESHLTWWNNSPYRRSIVGPLPINKSTSPDEVGDALNRHAVLHGLTSNYGTRVNSSKAISWLLFVADYGWHQLSPNEVHEEPTP